MHRIPPAEIRAHISRGMIDSEPGKIRICPPPHKTSAQISSPSPSQIAEQQRSRVFRAMDQRISRRINLAARTRYGTQRIFQDLAGRVGVSSRQKHSRPNLPLHFDLCPVRERLFQIEELIFARRRGLGLNLIMKEIVEVSAIQIPAACEESLL